VILKTAAATTLNDLRGSVRSRRPRSQARTTETSEAFAGQRVQAKRDAGTSVIRRFHSCKPGPAGPIVRAPNARAEGKLPVALEARSLTSTEKLDLAISAAQQQFHKQYGNQKDDYYGLVFFEHILQVAQIKAVGQIAFGNHDLGIDGFYFDKDQGTFRIFQFKNSKSARLFGDSLQSLIEHGMPALFGDHVGMPTHQPIVDEARLSLANEKEQISQVLVDFVFRGDPQEAEQSTAISNLKEQLEETHSWLVDKYFGDRVPLLVRFLRFDGIAPEPVGTDCFPVRLRNHTVFPGPDGLELHVGLVPLIDLYGIRSALGRRFLERNIRFALPPDGHVNRALAATFTSILLKRTEEPALFAFRHNGVTLSAGMLEEKTHHHLVYAPRLLNGAQTVSTFADFWERNSIALHKSDTLIDDLVVPCRIIVSPARPQFITDITISANRQNPVQSWQLHANDPIQLQLEDWFRDAGIPYQRQDRAFAKVPAEEWQQMEYRETRAVELVRLARTYLAAEGELVKLSHIGGVFERAQDYTDLFGAHRLGANQREVLVCYKAQFHLRRLADEIRQIGPVKYDFVKRTRELVWSLMCQALLNEGGPDFLAEFGGDLRRPHAFNERLRELSTKRVRFLLDELIQDGEYAPKIAEGNYSFMRTPAAFKKAMVRAGKKWNWKMKFLRSEA
jgi:hypothetical protein